MFPREIIERIRLSFRKDKELYSSFYKILGFYPRNISLYKQALLHKSSSVKSEKGCWMNNERLEFLGDAVLDSIVGDIVYRHFEGKREGFLTNTRSKIVQRDTLNRIAVEIGLDKLIKSSTHSSAHNSYMCGNAFEALVGAVYLDRGYDYCMRFMSRRILQSLINIDKVAYKEMNFKSKLIEWGQKNRVNVEFRLLEQAVEEGGAPVFNTEVFIEGIGCGTGKGYSKKESQQLAAKVALARLKKPQVQERVFARKGERTAQEEVPVQVVPEVASEPEAKEALTAEGKKSPRSSGRRNRREKAQAAGNEKKLAVVQDDDMDLSDIRVSTKMPEKDEIIAAAEEEAFRMAQ